MTTITKFQQYMDFTKKLSNVLVLNGFKVDYIVNDLNMRVVSKKEKKIISVSFASLNSIETCIFTDGQEPDFHTIISHGLHIHKVMRYIESY